ARQPGGSSASFLTFPPPKTTSSGSRAAIRQATTLATCCAISFCRADPGRGCQRSLRRWLSCREDGPVPWARRCLPQQRRNPDRSQAEEKHLASLVASQSLHGSVIIDDLDRAREGDPTRAEVIGLDHRSTMDNRPRVANRNHLILPLAGQLLDSGDHFCGRQLGPGRELPTLLLPGGEDFYGSPTYVNS